MIKDLLALVVGTVVSWHQYDLKYNTCHPQMAAAWVREAQREHHPVHDAFRDAATLHMPSETRDWLNTTEQLS